METKHTPGPWKWMDAEDDATPTARELIPADADQIGEYDSIAYHGADWPMREADAQLIADAPAMLSTLAGLLEHCAMVHRQWGDGSNKAEADAHIERARQLVAAHH